MEDFLIGRELKKIALLMKRTMGFRLRQVTNIELTPFQMDVIFFIKHSDTDVFQKDIERELGLKRPTVSLGLNHLEENGLIQRESVKKDARLKRIVLTEKAQSLAEKTAKILDDYDRYFQEGLSKEDIQGMARCFAVIKKNLTEMIDGEKHETK